MFGKNGGLSFLSFLSELTFKVFNLSFEAGNDVPVLHFELPLSLVVFLKLFDCLSSDFLFPLDCLLKLLLQIFYFPIAFFDIGVGPLIQKFLKPNHFGFFALFFICHDWEFWLDLGHFPQIVWRIVPFFLQLSIEVSDFLSEVIDGFFVQFFLLVESVFSLHDDFVHVLVFLFKLSDFGNNIRAGAGSHGLEQVRILCSEICVDSLEFIVLVFHDDFALMHFVWKVFFVRFKNTYFLVEVVNNFFKRLFKLWAFIKMPVPESLVLLFELVNFKLCLFLFQNDRIKIFLGFINEIFHGFCFLFIVGDFCFVGFEHLYGIFEINLCFFELSLHGSTGLLEGLIFSFVDHKFVKALSFAFGRVFELSFEWVEFRLDFVSVFFAVFFDRIKLVTGVF